MNRRLLPLARSKRALLGAGALICYAAAIVLEPSDVRSQLDRPKATIPVATPAPADPLPSAVAPQGDAFAPRVAVDDDPHPAPPAVTTLPPLPRLVAAPAAPARPRLPARVTAIAVGSTPTAIVDSSGTQRVVGVGNELDGSTIEQIDEDGIILTNGRRLLLEPATGR